jgi:parallel beta-helix repeat protein
VGKYLPTKNNYDGIRVENAVNARIHHNEITGWLGDHWNANGIKVYCSDGCVFEDNYIHGNHTGIFEKDSARGNIYRRNYITGNKALAFLGSNQTRRDRQDATYSVYENVFDGPVNLLTLSRGIEFHDNLLLGNGKDPDHAGYGLYASGGKVYQTKFWNNVCLGKPRQRVAYGLDQTRWSAVPPNNPLEYCDYNVYEGMPTYRFGRYSGAEDVFTLEQVRDFGFEKHTRVITGPEEIYTDQKSYQLKPEWHKSGRNADPVGPDDPASIMNVSRYGPAAMLKITSGSERKTAE